MKLSDDNTTVLGKKVKESNFKMRMVCHDDLSQFQLFKSVNQNAKTNLISPFNFPAKIDLTKYFAFFC